MHYKNPKFLASQTKCLRSFDPNRTLQGAGEDFFITLDHASLLRWPSLRSKRVGKPGLQWFWMKKEIKSNKLGELKLKWLSFCLVHPGYRHLLGSRIRSDSNRPKPSTDSSLVGHLQPAAAYQIEIHRESVDYDVILHQCQRLLVRLVVACSASPLLDAT